MSSQTDLNQNYRSVALVIGVTGLVGNSLSEILLKPETPAGPWKIYGVARRPRPRSISDSRIEYISCDVSHADETQAKLSRLTDVTHVFYVTWTSRETEAENCEANGSMLRNVLEAVVPHAPSLKHVVLQTGTKQYLGPYESIHTIQSHEPPFTEDLPRLPFPNFYYTLEDILIQHLQNTDHSVSWSVHRPNMLFGFSQYSVANCVLSFCVYAAICKHEGVPMDFPGSKTAWECYSAASDANLIAEQEIWAAVSDPGKNEAFNCSNGDVFKWKHLWSILAEKFEIDEYGLNENKEVSLVEMMKEKEKVWKEIVKKHNLQETKVEEIGTWRIVDAVMAKGGLLDRMRGDGILDSMNKSKELGFLGFRNSTKSFAHWIDMYRAHKIIP